MFSVLGMYGNVYFKTDKYEITNLSSIFMVGIKSMFYLYYVGKTKQKIRWLNHLSTTRYWYQYLKLNISNYR